MQFLSFPLEWIAMFAKVTESVVLDEESVDCSGEDGTISFGSQSSQNHVTSSYKTTGPSKQYLKKIRAKNSESLRT